jgi:Macrocin-O-methyltransferase (TylF)
VSNYNLSDFAGHTTFNQGFVPDSFATADNPDDLCWLHIDLNSALATSGALAFLYDRMRPGSVILFDDYAHRGYDDTRTTVDRFFGEKGVSVLQVPTGQAVAFKR